MFQSGALITETYIFVDMRISNNYHGAVRRTVNAHRIDTHTAFIEPVFCDCHMTRHCHICMIQACADDRVKCLFMLRASNYPREQYSMLELSWLKADNRVWHWRWPNVQTSCANVAISVFVNSTITCVEWNYQLNIKSQTNNFCSNIPHYILS